MAHLQRLIALAVLLLAVFPQIARAQFEYCATTNGALCPDKATATSIVMGLADSASSSYGPNGGPSRGPLYQEPHSNHPEVGQVGSVTAYSTYLGNDVQGFSRRYPYVPNQCETLEGQSYEAWNQTSSWPPSSSGCASDSQCAISIQVLSQPYATGLPGVISYRMSATYTGEPCTIEEPTDEAGQEDAGDGWTCDPATGLCTDPNGQGKLCTFNPDGTRSACVDYTPGDGTDPAPQDEEQPDDPRDKQTVSGGAGCTQAPACTSSNPIECAMLWQQWKTRCALEKEGSVSNAGCVNGLPTSLNCTNMDAAQCFALQKQHETSCFLSVAGTGEEWQIIEPGDLGNPSDFGDSAYGAGAGTAEGSAGAWRPAPGSGDAPEFDDSGWLSGRTCPVLPVVSISIRGNPISLDFNNPDLCWWLSLGSQLVLVFAALASIRIYAKVI